MCYKELIFGTSLCAKPTNWIILPIQTWEYWKWQNSKNTGSTIRWHARPIPPQCHEELARSPFSVFGKSFYFKTVSAHTWQGACMCVTSLQDQEDPDGGTVHMRSEVTGSLNTWSTKLRPEINSWEKGKEGVGLEKTGEKSLQQLLLGVGRWQKQRHNRITFQDTWLESREMSLYGEQGEEWWVGSRSATRSAETQSVPRATGVKCKTWGQTE